MAVDVLIVDDSTAIRKILRRILMLAEVPFEMLKTQRANFIIGDLKNMAEKDLGPLILSVPPVLFSRDFTTRTLGQHERTVIPFQCGEERFDARICPIPYRHPTRAARSGIGQMHLGQS